MTKGEAQTSYYPDYVKCRDIRMTKSASNLQTDIQSSCTELAAMIKEITQMEQSRKAKGGF